jgi:hypothetical protein
MYACDRSTPPYAADPAVPPPARASSTPPSQTRDSNLAQLSFDAADTNKDGVITRDEASFVPGLDFAAADTDGSSTLSRQEFAAATATLHPGG